MPGTSSCRRSALTIRNYQRGVEQTNSVLIPDIEADFRVNNTDETIHYDSRDKIHSTDRALGLNWEHHFGDDWTVTNNMRYSDKRAVWNTTAVVYPFATDNLVFYAIPGTLGRFGTYQYNEHGTGRALGTVCNRPTSSTASLPGSISRWPTQFPGQAVQANSLYFNPMFYNNNHMTEFIDQLTFNKKIRNMGFSAGGFYAKSKADLSNSTGGGVAFSTIAPQDRPRPTSLIRISAARYTRSPTRWRIGWWQPECGLQYQ